MLKTCHLGITREDIEGCDLALLPGDPQRVMKIAKYLSNVKKVCNVREFSGCIGEWLGEKISVFSTGIGGPSTSICVEELALLGIKKFIRIIR